MTANNNQAMGNDPEGRFAFGENWKNFLQGLTEARVIEAETSLKAMLGVESLAGKRFLDIGSGSGLFSLAARRLGARVFSFDYDLQSVECTRYLKEKFFPGDDEWMIEKGSALDGAYLERLGRFDVVYSWGVLHHTGAMWLAIELALQRVAPAGYLFVALYNDQGLWSRVWWIIKYLFNKLPRPVNFGYAFFVFYSIVFLNIIKYTILLKPMRAIAPLLAYRPERGMSRWHDIIDWIGGMPFEFVRYDVLQQFLEARGMSLVRGKRAAGIGCHEMVVKWRDVSVDG